MTSYLDDSVTDGASGVVTIGGPVFSRIQSKAFSNRWKTLLGKHRVDEPLHMTDFSGPMGKHRGMYPEMKLALFQGLVNLINEHKSYSISVMVSQADFTSQLTKEVQKTLIGPYALAFFSAIVVNNEWARRQNPGNRVAYLIDEGSSHTEQLLSAHAVIASVEKTPGEFCYTGTIAFDTDDRFPALQAADVIAWAARRKQIHGSLSEEFEPLNEVLSQKKPSHVNIPIHPRGIKMLADPINLWIARRGSIPTLADVIRK